MSSFARPSVRALLVAALALTALVYAPNLKAGLVYDDLWYLVRNPAIRSLHLVSFFRDPTTAAAPESGLSGDVYRPLSTLAFALTFKGWSLRAWPSHALCLALHLLNGILLWKILRHLLKDPYAALFGMLVFLLHPVQVQSVAWISQLPGLLGAASFLVALGVVTQEETLSWRLSVLGWIAFCMAVLLKETTVILPLVAMLFWNKRSRDQRRYLMGLILIAIFYTLCRQAVLHHLSQFSQENLSELDSLTLGVLAFPVFMGKIIAPVSLRVSYGYPMFYAVWIPAAIVILGLYLGAMVWFSPRAIPMRAMGWIILGLLPVLQIVPIRAFVAERFLYIPLMGVGLLAAWCWNHSIRAKPWLFLWMVYLVGRSAVAVPAWRSEQTLWAEAVRQEPTNAFAHACYAQSLGDSPQAAEEYEKALVNHPAYGIQLAALNNLASLHHEWGHTWKADYWRRKAEMARR